MTHNWCTFLETPLLSATKSLVLLCVLRVVSSKSSFSRILSPSVIFTFPKLTGEFTSLEEPSDDSSITTVSGLLADGSGFVESERWDEPNGPMRMLKLPIVNSSFDFRRLLYCCWLKAKKPSNS
jgi:hypothetical protein